MGVQSAGQIERDQVMAFAGARHGVDFAVYILMPYFGEGLAR
jgi:hypothetical protein